MTPRKEVIALYRSFAAMKRRAFGERSAMAVQAAQDAGLSSACHIQGGLSAWAKANGPVVRS